jgi:hypothetical protein
MLLAISKNNLGLPDTESLGRSKWGGHFSIIVSQFFDGGAEWLITVVAATVLNLISVLDCINLSRFKSGNRG